MSNKSMVAKYFLYQHAMHALTTSKIYLWQFEALHQNNIQY